MAKLQRLRANDRSRVSPRYVDAESGHAFAVEPPQPILQQDLTKHPPPCPDFTVARQDDSDGTSPGGKGDHVFLQTDALESQRRETSRRRSATVIQRVQFPQRAVPLPEQMITRTERRT